jgi:hypothetical protein
MSSFSTSSLLALIIVAALICIIVILLLVLTFICLLRRKRNNESTSNLSVAISTIEASKQYEEDTNKNGLLLGKEGSNYIIHSLSNEIVNKMQLNATYYQFNLQNSKEMKSDDRISSVSHPPIAVSLSNYSCGSQPFTICKKEPSDSLQVPSIHIANRSHSDTNISSQAKDLSLDFIHNDDIMHNKLNILQIAPSNIKIIKSLGKGNFGCIYLAQTRNLSATDIGLGQDEDKSKQYEVAVKVLQLNDLQDDSKALFKEVKCMSRLRHENVVQILAACWKDQKFIVLEYMKNGDLNTFLQQYEMVNMGPETYDVTISYHKLTNIALQIASAMKYLASCNFVHRDLATRNCLVGENFLVKIGDFGLSRNLYDSHYYRVRGSAVLPIRWMAPECFLGKFSEKSDVWAYGVTLWEVFTLCKCYPYGDLSDHEIIQRTLSGVFDMQVLERPECCSIEIYEIMKQCFKYSSAERPDFTNLYSQLKLQ